MACGLAVARGGLILGGLVLGLDVGGELVEFFDCAVPFTVTIGRKERGFKGVLSPLTLVAPDQVQRSRAPKVSQRRRSPLSSPDLNHRTRWAEVPCVNDSGTT
jgi:hypothetical protein